MDWFRSHHGAPTDPKWLMIAERSRTQPNVVAAIWWALMDFASQNEDRGSIKGFDPEELAFFYRLEKEVIENVLKSLSDKGLIDKNQRLKNWNKRQPQREDGSAERAREWRERKRTQANAEERPEQIQNRTDTEQSRTEINTDRAREDSVVVVDEEIDSLFPVSEKPPDPPMRQLYLQELSEHFPQIGISGHVNARILQMLLSWERAGVVIEDIREAVRYVQSRDEDVKSPLYYRQVVLSFAKDRQSPEPATRGSPRRLTVRELNAIAGAEFLKQGNDEVGDAEQNGA